VFVPLATTTLVALGTAVVVVVDFPLRPPLVVVVVAGVVVVVVVGAGAPPPATVVVVLPPTAVVVGVVVGGVLLTLGRVPTDTRTATATTKMMMTPAARTIESEPDGAVFDWSSSIGGPACPGTPPEASLSAGGTGGGAAGL
jgi:hypothetical protein